MPAFGLRGKILVFAVLLAILPLSVSSLSMITATRDELMSAVNDRLLGTTQGLLDLIRLSVEPPVGVLTVLRDGVDNRALTVGDKIALLNGALEGLSGLQALQLSVDDKPPVFLLQREFEVRLGQARVTPHQALAQPAAHGPDPSAGLTESPVLGDPLYLPALDAWLLPMWIAMREPIGGQSARLVAYLDLAAVRQALEAAATAESGGIWLLNAQGLPLLSDKSPQGASGLAELLGRLPSASGGSILVTAFERSDGTPMLGAIGSAELPPWVAVAAVTREQAYAALTRMQRFLGFWLALGLAVATAGALVLANRIGRPVREMADVTDQVGRGNFQVRVRERSRGDEIGILGNRLNRMIVGLADSHRQLDRLAHHDPLTGLPNRRSVLAHLDSALAHAQGNGSQVALLFLDLDRFKNVNDSLGHAVGDRLLTAAAERLSACLGPGDLAARLGGDEFLVVLGGVADSEAAAVVATRLIEAFSAPFQVMDYELYVGGTIGIAMAPEDGCEVAELIGRSDTAMYWAKEQGRGHYRFFDGALKAKAVRRLSLDGRLRRALDRQELEVYYQPQIDVCSGAIVSTEALIRWPDPKGGFVTSPGEFIPLAEETGLIVPLGQWVLDTVCRQACSWHQAGLPKVAASVNVSALQFRRPDFFVCVRQSLERSGLDSDRLGLELTEGILLDDTRHSIRLMCMLKEMGVKLSIDDFGTGYSSLAYLRQLPLDFVKMARELVMGVASNASDATIVDAVILLSKRLGLKTVAEGVETRDQLAYLCERSCDLIQGFYFSRPLGSQGFEALLAGKGRLQNVPTVPFHGG